MTITKSLEPLLDTASAAAFIGVDPASMNNWRSNGRVVIPFIKVGRTVRYRPEDLREFILQNRVTP